MADAVELRMKCPVCGVRNHSVTFQHDGPTLYHDCGHTSADLLTVDNAPEPTHHIHGSVDPPTLSPEAVEMLQRYKHGQDPNEAVMAQMKAQWTPPEPCPECAQNKHGNCDGTGWDIGNDMSTECPCARRGHGD